MSIPTRLKPAVRARLKAAERERADDPLARLSPLLRSAAAFLPLEVITGGKMPATAAKLAPATGAYKLLSYLAFPAISLFVLLGATVFSIVKIRSIREENSSGPARRTGDAARPSRQWWHDHKWGVWLVFAATIAMAWVGATWLLFLFYIVSFGFLLYVLTSLRQDRSGESLRDRPSPV